MAGNRAPNMAKVVPFDSCQIDTCTIPMDQAQMGKEDEGYTELMIRVEKKMMEWASKRKLVIPANVRSFPDIHANEHLIPHKVPVRLRVHIMAIDNVNTVQQQFYCKAWIQLKWYVQQEHLDDTETRNVAVGDTWKPDLFIQNAAGPVSVTNTMREITDEAGRRGILLSQVIEGQFSEPFELRHFPLDQQRLHLRFAVWNCAQTFAAVAGSGHADIVGCTALSSLTPVVQKAADQGADAVAKMSSEASTDSQPGISGRSGKQQQLLPFKRRVEFWRGSCQVYKEGFVQQDSWHLHEHVVVKQGLTHWERSDEGVSYATLNVFVTLSRKPGFYLWNVALPLCFLITLAFISVFLPAEDLPNRLQITLTLLLTLVAFKFVVSQYLPATSYQTWLDLYVTSGFTLLFVLAAQNWIVYILDREYPEEDTAKNFNRISAYVLIAGWGLLHAVVAVLVVLVLRARERHAVEDDGNVWGDRQEVDLPASEPLYALRVMQQEAGAACKAGQA